MQTSIRVNGMYARSVRLFLTALFALAAPLVASPAPTRAGDIAAYQVIGYSPNARYFAFVEYGRQDGSGFPYANLFVVDLDKDSFAAGPFRVRLENELASVGDALAQARDQASSALRSLSISEPARLAAADPPDEEDTDTKSLSFRPVQASPAISEFVRLSLETFPLPPPSGCEDLGEMVGFALSLQSGDGAEEVYRDKTIPKSRNCPLDYQVSGVWMPMDPDPDRAVAMISVMSFGFEGRDRRLIAVPVAF